MNFEDVLEVVSFTEMINGVQTPAEELKSIDISAYRIKGMWYFDKRQGEMKYRLLGLMPVGKNLKDDDGKNNTDLFWIWYPSIRKILHKEQVFNDKNNANRISYDQLLVSRRFSSFIYKEDNLYGDRAIKDYKNPGLESILESERIKKEILDFEQDMWNR
jgi:gliding motility associated protien GldN